jgi:hypothetical protein
VSGLKGSIEKCASPNNGGFAWRKVPKIYWIVADLGSKNL